jgi:hypothetical protein
MQTLLVYPNPWSAFDKNGVPCGVCPRDPEADAGGPGQYVGARVDKDRTKILQDFAAIHGGGGRGAKLAKHELRSPMQATYYQYMGVASSDPKLAELLAAKDPIEIPATKYYRDRLQEGSLIPATAETAQAARLRGFTAPKDFFALKAHQSEPPTDLGSQGLPQSPDAAGNVLDAPAVDEPRVEVASASLEPGGPPVSLELNETNEASASAESAESRKSNKRRQESSS